MTGRSRRVFGDIRFMVTPGARPRNIRVAGDGTLWGEVPLVLYREVAFEPTKGGRTVFTPVKNPRDPDTGTLGDVPDDLPGYQLKPDPLKAETVAEFMETLRRYRRWAGSPSYREMVQRVGTGSAAGFWEALNRDRLPKLAMLNAIIVALGGKGEYFQRWVTAWRSLDGRMAGAPFMNALPPAEEDTSP